MTPDYIKLMKLLHT